MSIGAALVAGVASWFALFIAVGNSGLQQAVAVGPETLLRSPLLLVVPLATALGCGLVWAWRLRPQWTARAVFVGALIAWNFVAALLVAPALIGELSPRDWGEVLTTITVFGGQVAAAGLGSLLSLPRSNGRNSSR